MRNQRAWLYGVLAGSIWMRTGIASLPEETPCPETQRALQAIARGTLVQDNVGRAIVAAEGPRCRKEVLRVFQVYSEESQEQQRVVEEGIRQARAKGVSIADGGSRLEVLAAESDLSRVEARRKRVIDVAKRSSKGLPPSGADFREGRLSTHESTMLVFVDAFLGDDLDGRITRAFRVFSASSCLEEPLIEMSVACGEVGLPEIQRAALRAALLDLRLSEGSPSVVQKYLKAERPLLDFFLSRGVLSEDPVISEAARVLNFWKDARRVPSRWEAWAAIERTLRIDLTLTE